MNYLSGFESIFEEFEQELELFKDEQLIDYFRDVQELSETLDSLVDITVKGQILDDELESDILSEYGFNLTSSLKKKSINLFTKQTVNNYVQVIYSHLNYLLEELTLRGGPYLNDLIIKNGSLNVKFMKSLINDDLINYNDFYENIANKNLNLYRLISYFNGFGNKLRDSLLIKNSEQLLINSRKIINTLSSKPRVMELFEEYVKNNIKLVDESRALFDKTSKRFIQESFYEQLLEVTIKKPKDGHLNGHLYI